jgi:hypothetical protein
LSLLSVIDVNWYFRLCLFFLEIYCYLSQYRDLSRIIRSDLMDLVTRRQSLFIADDWKSDFD